MAPRYKEYRTQIMAGDTGENVIAAGGKVQVCIAGTARKAAILGEDGLPIANPMTPTRGFINFFTAEAVAAVDLYIQDPFGNFIAAKGIVASGPNEIKPLSGDPVQVMIVPFSGVDGVGAERASGFTLPAGSIVTGPAMIQTTVAVAGSTISAGLLSTDPGNVANDNTTFANAASGAAVGSQVGGPAAARAAGGRNISVNLSAANTEGFLHIPIRRVAP